MSKYVNRVYAVEVVLFFLIIFGALPRWFAFVLAGILIIYTLFASLEDATVLFVRSIPLFIALPLTASFDNFNTWRVLAIIIFIKFIIAKFSIFNFQFPIKSKFSILLILLLLISILSIFVAQDKTASVLRIIYFANLLMVPIVISHLGVQHLSRIVNAFIPPLFIVLAVGFLQLASTYFGDIYQFVDFWGWGAQCRQFGMEWCRIAVEQGNTWFTYNTFGNINLRMFSLFTDSHTFPMFVLLALPAIFAKLDTKRHWPSILIPIAFLAVILSNTRGMWLAGWVMTLAAMIAMIWLRGSFRKVAPWLVAFVLLFAFVYPLSATPQFGLGWNATLGSRIRSILNFGETSNALRIAIWKASLRSIVQHPLLGVGIGNFPVVLQQDIELAKAGSSAHNVYLHVAAEIGIPALILFLWLLWIPLRRAWELRSTLYGSALLIMLPWIYGYLLTDAALFDERAFLIFAAVYGTLSINQSRLS
ncbi:MAG: O-antigen ligase family protein [Patescibacteria group bacterium]